MHGTGLFTAMGVLMAGGTIVTLEAASLNSQELWSTVERRGVEYMAIVGDAFAKPMLQELKDNPGRYDVSSVASIVSSGVMWSMEVKQEMLDYLPDECMLADSFGSSEAIGFGSSITMKDMPVKTAKFTTNDYCKVFDENDNEIPWGSETPALSLLAARYRWAITKMKRKPPRRSRRLTANAFLFRRLLPGFLRVN